MVVKKIQEYIPLPEGITTSCEDAVLTVKGEKGEISRRFFHPKVQITVSKDDDSDCVELSSAKDSLREKKIVRTFRAHIRNMFTGVTEGHEYQLKVCSGHFPMTVSAKNNTLEVKNLFGESVPRKQSFDKDVSVSVDGEIITVTGIDKELVSQTAASFERLTKRSGFDRKVFQDGIYIIKKDDKLM
ncbi:MAG: 50S ribosomal protein L6 [Nanobdellota archaeon]